nr:hypothetical protein CTI12_AA098400 [Tanacetum cinerariifolium]
MSYDILSILKRLVPNGFEKVYYCKSGAKLTSIREIKSDQDIVDMFKVGYDNGFHIDIYVDHFGYDSMEMVECDRNDEVRKTKIKAELDSSDDDLEEIENVDFHTDGDDSVVIKIITTQDLFLTKLCNARILFRGHVEFGVNEETPQVDLDDNQIDHYFKEIIEDSFMPIRKIRDDIRQKFIIDVSVEQCKRAKQLALFDHGGGLIEHYAKLYQYRQAILDSTPGSTCTMDVVEYDNGGELLTAMGRDANKQMYLIAWAVLPEAEHRECTRHIYANFKKKYSGLQYRRLFWAAASCTLEQQFLQIMDQIKLLDANAYDYLIQRNPNSWSRAFFEMDIRCVAFENGISESFNRAILGPRMKPIITMLEEIRLYIIQRTVAMNKLAFNLEDTITPSIVKRLEILKEKQREWFVYLSGFQELEVRKGYQSYGVSLQHKFSNKRVFGTNMWKRTNDVPPLPPIIRKMSDRPHKKEFKPQVKLVGARGGGRFGRGDGNDGSGSGSGVNDANDSGVNASSGSGVTDGSGMVKGVVVKLVKMVKGVVEGLTEEYQLELDEQAFRECMKEQARVVDNYMC